MAVSDQSAVVAVGGSYTVRVTLSATPGSVRGILLPTWCREIDIFCVQSDDSTNDTGKYFTSGTDEVAGGNDWFPIPSGQGRTVSIGEVITHPSAAVTIYISAATASGFAHLHMRKR